MILASVSLSAQTPAPGSSVSVSGCVAEAQRDGSTGAKATGTQTPPEKAADEANNPTPTGRYQLLDATPVAQDPAKPPATAYGLRGSETELAKHVGHRVAIVGSLLPPLAAKLPAKAAATAEGVRTVQVTSVKMVGTNCSPKTAEK